MDILQNHKAPGATLTAMLTLALVALMTGCEGSEQPAETIDNQADINQPGRGEQPLGEVAEFDGFTLRANVSPTDHLPDAMAQQYGIEASPDLVLLTIVILETRQEQQSVPVAGELSAHYENPAGHATDIDLREIEANNRISYIGTLDASGQRVFQFVIEAQPEGADQPLQMDFEVQLPELADN